MAVDLVIRTKVEGNAKQELNDLKNAGEQTSRSTDKLASSFSSLSGILAGVGFVALAKEAIGMADTYKLMEARMSLVTKSTGDLVAAQSKLFQISQDTRVSLEATTGLYTKMAMATDGMGKSQAQVLAVTKSVNEAMKISGASTAEATATVMQLGQALASGTLAGDEYKSLRENAPRLAKAIADGMGVQVGALKELSAQGKLTAEVVFDAIEKSGAKLDSEFKKIPTTVGDSIEQIKNSLLDLVGTTDKTVNGSGGLAEVFSSLSSSISTNKIEIVEFGRDFFRSLQAMGAGVIGIASGFMGVVDGIAGGIGKGLEFMLNKLIGMVNGALSLAETATNKIKGLFGGDAIKFGRVGYLSIGDEMLASSSQRFSDSANAFKTIGVLTKEIADFTTVAQRAGAVSDKEGVKIAGSIAPTKEQLAAAKKAIAEAKKAREEEEKVQRGYLEGYADLEAKQALDLYNTQLGYEESYRDIQAQNAIDQYNENVSNLNAWADLEAQAAIKKFEDETKFWDDLFVNVNKAMDNQFFDAMTGKFKSFGSWLKDFWSSITDSMARGLSKTLADSILGTGTSGGGLQNIFKSFGGLGSVFGSVATPSSMLGSTTDAMGFTTTAGGTVLDAVGNITKSGSDVSSVISQLSNANSLYSAATNGITGMIYAPSAYMGQLAGTAYGAGFTGTGSFLAGSSNVLAGGGVSGLSGSAYAGGLATAGAAGAAGGYAMGSLGDKLFGANTKAANYGAIGGAAGAMIGSVVPVVGTIVGGIVGAALGSVVGGAFGKTTKKLKDYGVMAYGTQSADGVDLDNYKTIKTTKKSWFKSSSKTKTKYTDMDASQQEAIRATFEAYDYLLLQMGDLDTTFVAAGKYTKDTFMDAMNKSFISAFVDDKSMTSSFYTTWQEYAKSINQTVGETFSQVISGYVGTTRSFNEWKLGSGTTEQLKFTADYLSKDLSSLEAQMGVSGVTVDNYLAMYDKAIKDTFTPETINAWKTLGDSLMVATDANTKYTDSLKALATAQVTKPADMMLSKVNDATRTAQGESLSVQLLVQIVKTLKSIQTTNQFSAGVALV